MKIQTSSPSWQRAQILSKHRRRVTGSKTEGFELTLANSCLPPPTFRRYVRSRAGNPMLERQHAHWARKTAHDRGLKHENRFRGSLRYTMVYYTITTRRPVVLVIVQASMWVVVNIMVPFWVPIIMRHLFFGVPKKVL